MSLPQIDEEALLEAVLKVISGHAVVKPGETLVIRVRDWTPTQVDMYQEYLENRHAGGEIPFRPIVVIGDELAIVKPETEAPASLPGLPTHAVVEIEWAHGGAPVSQKFGPWMIAPDDSHMAAIGGFVQGWSRGSGTEPAQVTLTVGDESIAEGATSPYRDQPSASSQARPT
jgi:hypothetical protein